MRSRETDRADGQLGGGSTSAYSPTTVAVKNLTDVTSVDGGYWFTLAATR